MEGLAPVKMKNIFSLSSNQRKSGLFLLILDSLKKAENVNKNFFFFKKLFYYFPIVLGNHAKRLRKNKTAY